MSAVDYTIATFDDAIEYIIGAIGSDFEKAIEFTNMMIDNPNDYTGPQAIMAARKLSNYRTKIGVAAQFWKLKSAETKRPYDRLTKDALMVIYDGLLEQINTLKAQARHERDTI